jgi:hypothetical protein
MRVTKVRLLADQNRRGSLLFDRCGNDANFRNAVINYELTIKSPSFDNRVSRCHAFDRKGGR